jgi:hypothetical protein
MSRPRAGSTLHELLAMALERAAQAQDESSTLIEQHRDVLTSLHDTLERAGRRRDATRRGTETDTAMPEGAPLRGSEDRQWRKALSPSGPERAPGHPRNARAASATTSASCGATSAATKRRATS